MRVAFAGKPVKTGPLHIVLETGPLSIAKVTPFCVTKSENESTSQKQCHVSHLFGRKNRARGRCRCHGASYDSDLFISFHGNPVICWKKRKHPRSPNLV